MQADFDIVVLGGGPAGSCATLRLLKMGYRVALIESRTFPRFQIGESLSPGVFHLLEFLGARRVLEESLVYEGLPSKVIWNERAQIFAERKPSMLVDRGSLDSGLIDLAQRDGLTLFQPVKFVGCQRQEDEWLVRVDVEGSAQHLNCRFIIDARGIAGTRLQERIVLSPASLATWSHIAVKNMPREVLIEALPQGWLWGAPVARDQYRIMLFTRGEAIKGNTAAQLLQAACGESQFFTPAKDLNDGCFSCLTSTYLHSEPWGDQYVRVGDCCFAIDPLSSSGVEKAVRISLQAAIAINSALKTKSALLSKNYYEEMLAGSMASHLGWTTNYYSSSWAAAGEFWRQRSGLSLPGNILNSSVGNKLSSLVADSGTGKAVQDARNIAAEVEPALHTTLLKLSGEAYFEATTCLAGDLLVEKRALLHPNLKSPLVYINNLDIAAILSEMNGAKSFAELLAYWTRHMNEEQASKIIHYLYAYDILQVCKEQ